MLKTLHVKATNNMLELKHRVIDFLVNRNVILEGIRLL